MNKQNLILMYHSIGAGSNGESDGYTVSLKEFKEQMRYVAGVIKTGTAPSLTFDDGVVDNYTVAYPILQEFGLKAYFFVIASKIGAEGYMDWKQIKELRDAGMIIGSHGMAHKILLGLDYRELNCEIRMSKERIEENLKASVDYFSIPYGYYNRRIIDKIGVAGYKAVFTSNPRDNDGFKLGRIAVRGSWNSSHFKTVINYGLSFQERIDILARDLSKRLLGIRHYNVLRERILAPKKK